MKVPERRVQFTYLIIGILLFSGTCFPQVGGRITGTVKDPTGAVVSGAAIAAVNLATGVKQTTKADSQGVYSFPTLAVGQYNIEVAAPGFTPYRRTGLVIDVNGALQVDVTLQLAGQSVTVEVNEQAAQIQVEKSDTEMGQTITGKQIVNVPLNGRSYTDLLALQAGVNPASTNVNTSAGGAGGFGSIAPSGGLNPGNFSINGQRESANGFILNGANVEESMAGAAAVVPNLDSIAEFRVLTSNFDAEYGEYAGGLVSTITKSGTNQIHGSVFEFLRNAQLNARGFFDRTRPKFNQNQYGGTLGGPIKKDKVFFFADFQGSRTVQGQSTGRIPVPSLLDRNGNLSDQTSFLGRCSGGACTVSGDYFANILSQRLGYHVTAGEPYYTSGCTSSSDCVFPNAVIPQAAWSAPAQNLLQYIPAPNVGDNTFSTAAFANRLNDAEGSARLDANTRFGALSAYYHVDNYNLNSAFPIQQGGANVPGFNALSNGQTQLVTLGDTKTFGPTTVNELRLSYLRSANNLGQASGGLGVNLASQGFAPASQGGIVPGRPKSLGIETVVLNSVTFGSTPFAINQVNQNYQLHDNFSKVTGNHTTKFGFQGRIDHIKQNVNLIENGMFQFTGTETGLDFADFLIGLPNTYLQSFTPQFDNRSRYAGIFAQDSWRIQSNLTLNYGVRWEYIPAWSLQLSQETATFIPNVQSVLFPGAPTGYVFPQDKLPNGSTIPPTIAPTPKNDFSPRIGIAWSLSSDNGLLRALTGGPGQSSIRAGYGRFFTAIEGVTTSYETGNPPYGVQYASSERPLFEAPFIGALTGATTSQPFPLNVPPANVGRTNPATNVDWSLFTPLSGAVGYYYKNPTPYSENYFFSLERQIGASTVLGASYIGSQGHHLITLLSANPGDPALCLSVSRTNQVAPGSPLCGPFGENGVYTRADGTVINGTRNPLGNKFGSDAYFYNYGNSVYNSLQVTAKHNTNRLSLLGSYTYGKSIDLGSNVQEQLYPYNYKLRRAPSSFDLRHNFVVSYRYEFPFEKLFGKSRIATGWALSGITRYSTGLPVTLVDLNDNSLIGSNNQGVNGGGSDLPNFTTGNLAINRNPRNGSPYFNTSLFGVAPLGSPGNSPRRFFYGPGMDNWDIALLKFTRLTESKVLEMRLETFNTFNHAQFFGATSVNANISSTSFGQVVSAMPGRVMQVAAKFNF